MEHVIDRVELPMSGIIVELVNSPVGLFHWRLQQAGATTAGVGEPLERTPILGWRRVVRPRSGRRQGPLTIAWGSLLGGRGPLRVVVIRRRRFRALHRVDLEAITLCDVLWVAEADGVFDQLVVADGTVIESRDLVDGYP